MAVNGDPITKAVTAGLGLITALVTLLTGFGVATGGLDRLLRDSPTLSAVAIACATIAAVLYILVLTLKPSAALSNVLIVGFFLREKIALLLVAAFFVTAIGAGVWAVLDVSQQREQPNISGTVSTDGGLRFKGSVHVTGVAAAEHVQIRVYGVKPDGSLDVPALMRAEVGPSQTGVVDYQIDTAISPGLYPKIAVRAWIKDASGNDIASPPEVGPEAVSYCNLDKKLTSSCLVLDLPAVPSVPQLSAGWESADSNAPTLQVKVSGHNMTAGRMVSLTVTATAAGARLYAVYLAPDSTGTIDDTIVVPATGRAGEICVAARLVDQSTTAVNPPTCSEQGANTVWVVATVPGSK